MQRRIVFLTSIALITGLLAWGTVGADEKKGATRPATTKHLMKGIVAPNCKALAETLKANPSDDEAWEQAAMYAALLNEAHYILMADSRCPSGEWAGAAETLKGCSNGVLEKINAKDVKGANAAFQAMMDACKKCHKAHKKEK